MRAAILVLALTALPACSTEAQRRWEPVQGPTSQTYRLDLASLKKVRDILQVDVRSSSGTDSYDIVPHQVRCSDLSVRLGTRRTYDSGTNLPFLDNTPSSPPPLPEEGWIQYGPGSDGHHLAVAICSAARSRKLG
jgi:hypothetical protein